METLQKISARCIASQGGASLVEYTLLLGLIALVCISAIGLFGGNVGNSMSRSAGSIVGS